jgi:ABC-type nitrate/sulfonate/bicarbonate transport system substrate-binding protein
MIPIAQQGKQTQVIWAMQRGGASSYGVAKAGINSLKDCKRVAGNVIGLSGYGTLLMYKEALNASFEIIQVGDTTQIIPSVLSGQNDCAMAGLSAVTPGLQSGLHLLFDPRKDPLPDPQVLKATGDGLWGLKDNIDKKKSAVVKLMKALNKGQEYLRTHTDDEIAAALQKHPDMTTRTIDNVKSTFLGDKPFLTFADQNPGAITEATWQSNLKLYGSSFPYAANGQGAFSYANMVNMSYLSSAG